MRNDGAKLRPGKRRYPAPEPRPAQERRPGEGQAMTGHRARRLLGHVINRVQDVTDDHPDAEGALAWIGELCEIDDAQKVISCASVICDAPERRRLSASPNLVARACRCHAHLDRSGGRIYSRRLGPLGALR
jgi:hypothetical protein